MNKENDFLKDIKEIEGVCKCDYCLNPEKAEKQEKVWMEENGWFSHVIEGDPGSPTTFNLHTHGLPHTYKHLDLQIVYPLDPKLAQNIIGTATEMIKKGTVFEEDKEYDGLIKGFKVKFKKVTEGGRDVMRMILPDKYGDFYSHPGVHQWDIIGD